ncbi:MAG: hypothetical protein M1829_001182 [Trizodia sp. TS-e1964]|nr:MAG: hypothetical protein M1829_001182 [Trizodia sp. TS-e1964]
MPSKTRKRPRNEPPPIRYLLFLELPAFVRQRICRLLLCSSPNLEPMLSSDHPTKVFAQRIKTSNDANSGWYNASECFTPVSTLLAITLTCRTISNESISVFYHDNHFVFSDFDILTKFLKGVGVKRRYMISNVSICMEGKAAAKAFALLGQSKHLHCLRLHFSLDSLKGCPKKDDMDIKERTAFFPALKKLKQSIKGLDRLTVTGLVTRALRQSLRDELMRPNPGAWECKIRKLMPPKIDEKEEESEAGEEEEEEEEEAAAENKGGEAAAGRPESLEALDWGDERKPKELRLRESISRFVMTTVLGFGHWGGMYFDLVHKYDYSSSEDEPDNAADQQGTVEAAPLNASVDNAQDAAGGQASIPKPKAKTSRKKRTTEPQVKAQAKEKPKPKTKEKAAAKAPRAPRAPKKTPARETKRGTKAKAKTAETETGTAATAKAVRKPRTKPPPKTPAKSNVLVTPRDEADTDGEGEAEAQVEEQVEQRVEHEVEASEMDVDPAQEQVVQKGVDAAAAEAQVEAHDKVGVQAKSHVEAQGDAPHEMDIDARENEAAGTKAETQVHIRAPAEMEASAPKAQVIALHKDASHDAAAARTEMDTDAPESKPAPRAQPSYEALFEAEDPNVFDELLECSDEDKDRGRTAGVLDERGDVAQQGTKAA